MRTDLLVKLRISLILRGGLPVAGGTPCDFLDWLCASPSPLLSWFWTSLFRAHWHETMASGRTRRRTYEGGSRAETTRQPQSLVLRRGRRLRSRHLRGRRRPLRRDHHRRQGRYTERDENPRAQPQDEMGRG